MNEHGLLVALVALRADRALRGALLREPAEADEREAAAREELRHEREREHASQAEPARLVDACRDQSATHALAACLRPHREGADLGEIAGEHRERDAPFEPVLALGDEEVVDVLEEEVAGALEHAILGGVSVDER